MGLGPLEALDERYPTEQRPNDGTNESILEALKTYPWLLIFVLFQKGFLAHTHTLSLPTQSTMTLGIGGATPYSMKSNHQTAYNHSFRDTTGYDPAKNNKVKCSFCGCWAKKGSTCYQCKRPVGTGGHSVAPYPSQPSTPRVASASRSSFDQPGLRPRSSSGRLSTSSSRVPDNALQHQFRDTSGYDPSARLKAKCSFCGCWANRGAACYFCKTFNK